MEHEIAAERGRRDARGQQQARCPDAVARHHHGRCGLPAIAAGAVAIPDARRHAAFHHDLLHHATGAQIDAAGDRARPIGQVGRGFRAAGAAELARAAVIAGCARAFGDGIDRGIGRPPVPAERIEAARRRGAQPAQRQRRHAARFLRRIGGIARQPRDPEGVVVEIVIGLEIEIGERPVVPHSIEGSGLEIRRMQAREMRGPVDGRAADPVPHQRLESGAGIVDRIIGGDSVAAGLEPQIGRCRPRAQGQALPVRLLCRKVAAIEPVATLEARDAQPRRAAGKAPRERSAAQARSDDRHIDRAEFDLAAGRHEMLSRLPDQHAGDHATNACMAQWKLPASSGGSAGTAVSLGEVPRCRRAPVPPFSMTRRKAGREARHAVPGQRRVQRPSSGVSSACLPDAAWQGES